MSSAAKGILLVEDDDNDVFFMQWALQKANLPTPMHLATNGEEAIAYLSGAGKYSDRLTYPMPCCVFLDLKLPFVHGFEVLEWLRAQPGIASLDVYVLTSSPEERDRQKAEQLGAKAYLIKPPTAQKLLEILGPDSALPSFPRIPPSSQAKETDSHPDPLL